MDVLTPPLPQNLENFLHRKLFGHLTVVGVIGFLQAQVLGSPARSPKPSNFNPEPGLGFRGQGLGSMVQG